MSWRKENRRAERGYHHGNLKEALLQAALDLIAQKGAAGFTFADAARMAGVSPAAPYRHFRDRDELLSPSRNAASSNSRWCLRQAWDDGRPDTVTAFERVARPISPSRATSRRSISAMSKSGIRRSKSGLDGRGRARICCHQSCRGTACRAGAARPARPPALMMALHIWSMSHGVASLFGRGDAARRKLPMSPEDLLEAEVLIYMRGLGFPTDRKPSGHIRRIKNRSAAPVPPWSGPK